MSLAKNQRKALLVLHIVSAGTWVGIDVAMGILVFAAMSDATLALACYQALAQFAVWPVLITGVISLVTGVVLGLGSKYGLIRYWWVAVKLVLNVVLCVLVLFLLRTSVLAAAAGGPVGRSMIFPPIMSTAILIFAAFLGVFKPWGRVRQRTYQQNVPVTDAPATAGSKS